MVKTTGKYQMIHNMRETYVIVGIQSFQEFFTWKSVVREKQKDQDYYFSRQCYTGMLENCGDDARE